MGQSLSKVYVHIIFSTKNRVNSIDKQIESRLFHYLGGICKRLACYPIKIGGYKNHIHILCQLSKKVSQSRLIEEIKKQSSKWMKSVDQKYSRFYWQNGYGIFSVNPREINSVKNYIINQEEHHRKKSFQEEYRSLLIEHDIDFDERYYLG